MAYNPSCQSLILSGIIQELLSKDREGVNVGTNEAGCEGCCKLGHFCSIFSWAPPEAFGSHRSSSGKVEKLQGQGRCREVFPKSPGDPINGRNAGPVLKRCGRQTIGHWSIFLLLLKNSRRTESTFHVKYDHFLLLLKMKILYINFDEHFFCPKMGWLKPMKGKSPRSSFCQMCQALNTQ